MISSTKIKCLGAGIIIGLIDVDSKLPNFALMKISGYYKKMGVPVEFVKKGRTYEKIYASAIFSKSRRQCENLMTAYGDKIEIGGSGWSLTKRLPLEIEKASADYELYTAEMIFNRIRSFGKRASRLKKAEIIVNSGLGFTSRGCINNCGFCIVPEKEGALVQAQSIRSIINPKSNVIILSDNNFTADPCSIDKLKEIKERDLVVDINQGFDVKVMTDEIAFYLSQVKHLRSLHYSWDLMGYEDTVIAGIKQLQKYIKPYRHMCYILVGYNTTFEEDMYRFKKLVSLGVKPYVMVYNNMNDMRLKHFARWCNMRYHTACSFEKYEPWVECKEQYGMCITLDTLSAAWPHAV